MLWVEVVEVLQALDEAAVGYWVAGGWGVDLLVDAETRTHRDLDLAVDARDHEQCMNTLNVLGYLVETDWLPLRVEVAAANDRWVDVHPVTFDSQGLGVQGDPTDVHFLYPADAFTTGRLHGRTVPCLSAGQQQRFHSGYPPRDPRTSTTSGCWTRYSDSRSSIDDTEGGLGLSAPGNRHPAAPPSPRRS